MKYKKLTKEQLIISLDRLTRFKNTESKYLRVFTDILLSCMIEPVFKKKDIESMDYSEITRLVSTIINDSIETHDYNNNSVELREMLLKLETSVFNVDKNALALLKNNINFEAALDCIPKPLPVNLLWLKTVAENKSYTYNEMCVLRENYALKFPVEKIVLVEGITEEILLPAFSKFLGYDFYKKGVQIIAAGGKNQVVKMYYELTEEVKLPIFVLLDRDAEENIANIKPRLRETDKIHLVSCGEFEDLLPHSLIIKTVNSHFENFLKITEEDFDGSDSNANILTEIFKTRGLHEFKKAEFAKLVREKISGESDISAEIKDIINEIFTK